MATLTILAALMAASPIAADTTLKFTGDLGFVNTTGNTEITTMNVGERIEFAPGAWGVVQTFSVIYGRTDGEVSTSLWRGTLRGDRTIASKVKFYVLGEADRNTFAGISSRYNLGAGIATTLLESETDKLGVELGAGYVWQNAVAPAVDQEFSAGRAAARYDRKLGEKAAFMQVVELLPNFKTSEDLRINSETAITAPIMNGLSMKASYIIRYDGLPEPDFKKTDRILTTGVQVTF
jgi:putative salt-induced outer membrane protein